MKIKDKIKTSLDRIGTTDVELEGGSLFGDFSISPGELQKIKLNPQDLAKRLEKEIEGIEVKFENDYLNIYLSDDQYLDEIKRVYDDDKYYINEANANKTIILDYSQPNIAKPFSVGHLRSTIIGQANYNVHKKIGFKTIGINHIGDWGTQFGKLIYAVKTWGNEEEIESDPINQLVGLYQKFHREAEENPKINEAAAQWFRKLELNDEEATILWKKCIKWSFTEFDRLYKVLGVEIDETVGESFYADKTDRVISELREKGLLHESEGAQIVDLEGMPPAIIQKTNESTLYLTRDLAAIKYRVEKYHPDEIIYHVGNDQNLHFRQLFAVVKKLGWCENTKLTFAGHGLMRLPEGKMSTRAGRIVLLDDLISEAQKKSRSIIDEKNPDLQDKEDVAKKIGISSIKYADLFSNRKSDVVFSFEKMISLKGNSAPYLQYTYARTVSIIKRVNKVFDQTELKPYLPPEARDLAKLVIFSKNKMEQAANLSSPNFICDLAFKICEEFNRFYEKKKVVTASQEESLANAYIVGVTQKVLGLCFDILGLDKIDEI